MYVPVLTVAGDDSQLVGPGQGHVRVPYHHHCIQTLGQGELDGYERTEVHLQSKKASM